VNKSKRGFKYFTKAVLYTFSFFLALAFITPHIWAYVSSFKPHAEIFKYAFPLKWQTFVPLEPTLENYREVFTLVPFARYMLNTLFVASITTVSGLFVNSLAAYAFARLKFPGRDLIFFLLLSTLIISPEVVMVPRYLIVNMLGWIDTHEALIIPGIASAFGIFLLRQFFKDIPRDLDDAARIDGCSWFGIYLRIVLPLSKPGLITLGLITFLANWSAFLWPLIVINSPEKMLIEVGIASFSTLYVTFWGRIFAAGTLASFPIVVVFMILQRYYIRGISMSGFK